MIFYVAHLRTCFNDTCFNIEHSSRFWDLTKPDHRMCWWTYLFIFFKTIFLPFFKGSVTSIVFLFLLTDNKKISYESYYNFDPMGKQIEILIAHV